MSRTLHTARRRAFALGLMASLVSVPLAVPLAGSAAAATVTSAVSSTAGSGLVYLGSQEADQLRVSLAGSVFSVDTAGPVTAGAGCTPVPGDTTKVSCTAFVGPGGQVRPFRVVASGGDDRITNTTSVTMNANGGLGNDVLTGGPGTDTLDGSVGDDMLVGNGGRDNLNGDNGADTLSGGPATDRLRGGNEDDSLFAGDGDGDFLDGGRGADVLDGGSGVHDEVSYEFRTGGLAAVIDTAGNGQVGVVDGAGDTIRSTVEDLVGGGGDDFLVGSAADNEIFGRVGRDLIAGRAGADVLFGGDGDDVLLSNELNIGAPPFTPTADGAKDRLDGSFGNDSCDASPQDGDTTSGCDRP